MNDYFEEYDIFESNISKTIEHKIQIQIFLFRQY